MIRSHYTWITLADSAKAGQGGRQGGAKWQGGGRWQGAGKARQGGGKAGVHGWVAGGRQGKVGKGRQGGRHGGGSKGKWWWCGSQPTPTFKPIFLKRPGEKNDAQMISPI